jgi:hypothetical protein
VIPLWPPTQSTAHLYIALWSEDPARLLACSAGASHASVTVTVVQVLQHAMEPGARVRAVRGEHAGCSGTVKRTTPCYAFVEFLEPHGGAPRVAKKLKQTLEVEPVHAGGGTEDNAAQVAAQAAAQPLVWSSERPFVRRYGPAPLLRPDGTLYEPRFATGIPAPVLQQMMFFLLEAPDQGLMAAARTCQHWRRAVAHCAWCRLDLSALGGWESRQARQRARRGTDIDLTGQHTYQFVDIKVAFCSWMLHMARTYRELSTMLASVRTDRFVCWSYNNASPCGQTALVTKIVDKAANLRELHIPHIARWRQREPEYQRLLSAIRGKPLRVCHGINDDDTLRTLVELEELECTDDLASAQDTLSAMPKLRRVHLNSHSRTHQLGMVLRLHNLQSLVLDGKNAPSLSFGSELPRLIEYREDGLYNPAEQTDDFLCEVLAACCPSIDLTQYRPAHRYGCLHDTRGVWSGRSGPYESFGGPYESFGGYRRYRSVGTLATEVEVEQRDWKQRKAEGRLSNWGPVSCPEHVPSVSNPDRSRKMRDWAAANPGLCGARLSPGDFNFGRYGRGVGWID